MNLDIELAESLAHALELLSGADPETRPVAGATDLLLRLEAGKLSARRLISIADLPELSWVQPAQDVIRFGAGTSIAELGRHPELAADFPLVVEAARQFASPQIRNRATVGGNIGNASPAADLVPALIALGAKVTLQSRRERRGLALEELFLGFGKTALRPEELITELELPRRKGSFQAFAKFGGRGANAIAVVNMAICLELEGEHIASARVAYGSVAPGPLRATGVESYLRGQRLSEALIAGAKEAVLAEIAPIDDLRASRKYRQRLAVSCTEDALVRALEQARAPVTGS